MQRALIVIGFGVILAFVVVRVLLAASPSKPAPADVASHATVPENDAPLSGTELAQGYCADCHEPDGNSTEAATPKLAGQKGSYIRMQLEAFKKGARTNKDMSQVGDALSETQIDQLAAYFSRQKRKSDSAPSADTMLARAGAYIYDYPIGRTPACAACHSMRTYGPNGPRLGGYGMMGGGMMGGMMGRGMMGMGMMGVDPATVPNLEGQHAAYLLKQLNAFATGARYDSVMTPIADALSARNRQAVADYLSAITLGKR